MLLLIPMLLMLGTPASRVQLKPLDFPAVEHPQAMVTSFEQIESNNYHLFLLAGSSPFVVELNEKREFVRQIGGKGQGPGKLGNYGSSGLSVTEQGVFILSNHRGLVMNYYEQGKHMFDFQLVSVPVLGFRSTIFAASDQHIMTAGHPSQHHLAFAYNFGGKPEAKVGELLPMSRKDLAYNPALNDTHWLFDGQNWYCLFKFRPFLRIYSQDLELIHDHIIDGPEISNLEKAFFERAPKPNRVGKYRYPRGHFDNVKLYGNHLYFFAEQMFYQVDKQTGVVKNRTAIYLDDPKHPQITPDINLRFSNFTFLNGQLILLDGSAEWLGRHFWTVDLPYRP